MAPKKALPPPPPPTTPEPEEEEETSEEESEEGEEGEESEEESEVEEKEENKEKTTQIQPSEANKKPDVQKQTTQPPPAPQSEEEEEEESGSEEEEEGEEDEESDSPPSPNASDFTLKPITPTKPASKDAKPTPKRASDAPKDDGKDLRDRKKAKINEGEEKKEKGSAVSAGAGRLWTEDDEIAVLEGMIDYQNRRGADPSTDMAAFHEFVKRKLHADMSKTQLYEKVRRLKKKFSANVEKVESGEDPVFSKPHESRAFDLSKRIWGSGAQNNGGGVDNVNAKGNAVKARKGGKIGSISGIVKEGGRKGMARGGSPIGIVKEEEKDDLVTDDVRGDGNFQSTYPHLSQSFNLDGSRFFPNGALSCLKKNLCLIDSEKARELDEKWKKLRQQEAEFFLKRMTLMAEQTKLVLNAGKKR